MNRLTALLIALIVSAISVGVYPSIGFVQEGQTPVTLIGVPYGGAETYKNIDLGATKQQIKATQGNIYGWHLYNAAASTRFFKFVYRPAASVTVGTTVPDLVLPIPAGAAANVAMPDGVNFRNGLTAYCVTAVADNSTAAPSTNDCQIELFYK